MFKIFTSSDAHFQAMFAPFLYIMLVVGQVTVKLGFAVKGTGFIVKVFITQKFTLQVFKTCEYLVNAYPVPSDFPTKFIVINFDIRGVSSSKYFPD